MYPASTGTVPPPPLLTARTRWDDDNDPDFCTCRARPNSPLNPTRVPYPRAEPPRPNTYPNPTPASHWRQAGQCPPRVRHARAVRGQAVLCQARLLSTDTNSGSDANTRSSANTSTNAKTSSTISISTISLSTSNSNTDVRSIARWVSRCCESAYVPLRGLNLATNTMVESDQQYRLNE